ncbi:unnamed protein product [Merluccius merluccius]
MIQTSLISALCREYEAFSSRRSAAAGGQLVVNRQYHLLQEKVCGLLAPPGAEGAVFSSSIETPHVRAEPFKELRLESPTRSLIMEAPKGVQILAEAGDIQASCRNELRLESKDGEISLDARRIRLLGLLDGKASSSSSSSGTRQTVYEVCVCPNGRLFLSQAGTGSTCHINHSVCL